MGKWGAIVVGLMAAYQTTSGQISNKTPPPSTALPKAAITALDQVYNSTETKFDPEKSKFSFVCGTEKLTVFDNDSTVYGIAYIVAAKTTDSAAYTSKLIYGERMVGDKKQSNNKQPLTVWERFKVQKPDGQWTAPNTTILEQLQADGVGNFPLYLLDTAPSCEEILHKEKPKTVMLKM